MDLLQRLLTRLLQVIQRLALHVDYLQFVNHEIILLRSFSGHVELPQDVVSALTELSILEQSSDVITSPVQVLQGEMGRPQYIVSPQHLKGPFRYVTVNFMHRETS